MAPSAMLPRLSACDIAGPKSWRSAAHSDATKKIASIPVVKNRKTIGQRSPVGGGPLRTSNASRLRSFEKFFLARQRDNLIVTRHEGTAPGGEAGCCKRILNSPERLTKSEGDEQTRPAKTKAMKF